MTVSPRIWATGARMNMSLGVQEGYENLQSGFASTRFKKRTKNNELSVREAMRGHERTQWQQAMKNKVAALKYMQSWDIVEPLSNERIMDKMFVLKRKRDESGSIRK